MTRRVATTKTADDEGKESVDAEIARAALMALVHVAYLHYRVRLENAVLRAHLEKKQPPDRAFKLTNAQEVFELITVGLPVGSLFRKALEDYAPLAIAALADDGTPPPPPSLLN